jgi:hypothetical protein
MTGDSLIAAISKNTAGKMKSVTTVRFIVNLLYTTSDRARIFARWHRLRTMSQFDSLTELF